LVRLTESGQRIIQQAFQRHAQNLERVAGVLTDRERCELVRLLKIIGRNAERCIPGKTATPSGDGLSSKEPHDVQAKRDPRPV
jgi:hypothetical protein